MVKAAKPRFGVRPQVRGNGQNRVWMGDRHHGFRLLFEQRWVFGVMLQGDSNAFDGVHMVLH